MLSKARKWAPASIGVPLWENLGGRFFQWPSYIEEFFWGLWQICKMPCKRVSLSKGALLGNLEEVCLPEFLREKKSIYEFLSLIQRTLRF
jgi:hypothetical protein